MSSRFRIREKSFSHRVMVTKSIMDIKNQENLINKFILSTKNELIPHRDTHMQMTTVTRALINQNTDGRKKCTKTERKKPQSHGKFILVLTLPCILCRHQFYYSNFSNKDAVVSVVFYAPFTFVPATQPYKTRHTSKSQHDQIHFFSFSENSITESVTWLMMHGRIEELNKN